MLLMIMARSLKLCVCALAMIEAASAALIPQQPLAPAGLLPAPVTSTNKPSPLPLVVWHGLGDKYAPYLSQIYITTHGFPATKLMASAPSPPLPTPPTPALTPTLSASTTRPRPTAPQPSWATSPSKYRKSAPTSLPTPSSPKPPPSMLWDSPKAASS